MIRLVRRGPNALQLGWPKRTQSSFFGSFSARAARGLQGKQCRNEQARHSDGDGYVLLRDSAMIPRRPSPPVDDCNGLRSCAAPRGRAGAAEASGLALGLMSSPRLTGRAPFRQTKASDPPPAPALPADRVPGAPDWCPRPAPRTCKTQSGGTVPRGQSRNQC